MRLAAMLALVLLAAGCGSGQSARPATAVRGPSFAAAAGWHTLGYGLTQPPNAPDASAANVPFAAADMSQQSPPANTEASLPHRGILIWAQLQSRWTRVDRRFPVRRAPLRLADAVPSPGMEGFAPAGSVRRLEARLDGYDVDVSIFFGAEHPSAAEVTAANRELARLTFPRCPSGAEPLVSSDAETAATATLEWLRRSLVEGFRSALRGARAEGTVVESSSKDVRVQIVRGLCGRASDRMVAVRVYPSKQGSSELGGELMYFLAKTPRGWLVWRWG